MEMTEREIISESFRDDRIQELFHLLQNIGAVFL